MHVSHYRVYHGLKARQVELQQCTINSIYDADASMLVHISTVSAQTTWMHCY